MGRTIGGGVAALLTGFILVALLEGLGHALFPAGPWPESMDPAEMAAYMESMPLASKLSVVLAWGFGAMGGALVGGLIDRSRPVLMAAIPVLGVCLGTVINAVLIPHPVWMIVLGLNLVPIMGVLAIFILRRLGPEPISD